jgi:hypothetical protein
MTDFRHRRAAADAAAAEKARGEGSGASAAAAGAADNDFQAFYGMSPAQRVETLLRAIRETHRRHFQRNAAYRRTLELRGLGPEIGERELPGLLRVSAITFKSYIRQEGIIFPQAEPQRFLRWLQDHVSLELPEARLRRFKRRYPSLEALFRAVESIFSDLKLEVVTSSGTSGKASILIRDASAARIGTRAYFTAIDHMWGFRSRHNLLFVMPHETRVAMARIARMGTRELGWGEDGDIAYTMPFKADPDTIRIQSGRLFRPGLAGLWERTVLYPFMEWAYETLGSPKFVQSTVRALERFCAQDRPILVLGGLIQLDAVARKLIEGGGMRLPAGSRVATGGGMKQDHPRSPTEIGASLREAFRGPDGEPVPVADIYGMAEAHWVAFQCAHGNYHFPPWVYVAVMDDDDRRLESSDATGLLAFWDPLGGGDVYPPFFQTADRVRLINGSRHHDPALVCPCGEDSPYLEARSIQRVDLLEEAGCGATL